MALKTNFVDFKVGEEGNKYEIEFLENNLIKLKDATDYEVVGDYYLASDLNDTNRTVNELTTEILRQIAELEQVQLTISEIYDKAQQLQKYTVVENEFGKSKKFEDGRLETELTIVYMAAASTQSRWGEVWVYQLKKDERYLGDIEYPVPFTEQPLLVESSYTSYATGEPKLNYWLATRNEDNVNELIRPPAYQACRGTSTNKTWYIIQRIIAIGRWK